MSEKASSESDSDPFDRVPRIKKMRWREEAGSQPGCDAAAASHERSHDQEGAGQKNGISLHICHELIPLTVMSVDQSNQ